LIRSADREINSELDSTTGKNVKEKVADISTAGEAMTPPVVLI
jgi:hypothetical protein